MKLRTIFLFILIALISLPIIGINSSIKYNKVYSREIDLSQNPKYIHGENIDKDKIIKRSIEIISSLFPDSFDSNLYSSTVNFNKISPEVVVDFIPSDKSLSVYYVFFNLNTGELFNLFKINSHLKVETPQSKLPMDVENLKSIAFSYFSKLPIYLDKNMTVENQSEIPNGWYILRQRDQYFNKSYEILLNIYTGDFIAFKMSNIKYDNKDLQDKY